MTHFATSMVVCMAVAIAFDAILHGLSSHGHSFLSKVFEANRSRRTSPPLYVNSLVWHIVADALFGLTLFLLLFFTGSDTLVSWLFLSLIVGALATSEWAHMYAETEVDQKIPAILSASVFVKAFLVLAIGGAVYY